VSTDKVNPLAKARDDLNRQFAAAGFDLKVVEGPRDGKLKATFKVKTRNK